MFWLRNKKIILCYALLTKGLSGLEGVSSSGPDCALTLHNYVTLSSMVVFPYTGQSPYLKLVYLSTPLKSVIIHSPMFLLIFNLSVTAHTIALLHIGLINVVYLMACALMIMTLHFLNDIESTRKSMITSKLLV